MNADGERRQVPDRRTGDRRMDDAVTPQRVQGALPGVGDLLTAIIDSSDDAILSKTLDGTITSWNAAAERMYGYTAAEAVGQNVTMLAPADRLNEMAEILRRVTRGERLAHYVTERKAKDGRLLEVTLSISPIFDHEGTIVGASSLAHELTDTERRTASMDTLGKRIANLTNNVSDLAASVGDFMSKEQVTEEIVQQQEVFASRLRTRTLLGLIIAVFIGAAAGATPAWLVGRQAHKNDVKACLQRRDANQAIRDIVDRSQQTQIDVSKLSPTAREILAEFARAQSSGDRQSLHDFVYSKTPIPDCSKI